MRPSSSHLYPQSLRPGTARDGAAGSSAGLANAAEGPELLGAWRLWERMQAFDRRYGGLVDVALAAALFVLCSGAFFTPPGASPNLLIVAALTFPLVFRRRAR